MLSRFRIAARTLVTMQTRTMEITSDSRRFQQFEANQRENRLERKALYSAELMPYVEPILYASSLISSWYAFAFIWDQITNTI